MREHAVRSPHDHLARHLSHEIEILREFLVVLDEERRALSTPDAGAALAATTVRKTRQADALQASAQTRAAFLAELGFADAPQNLGPVCQQYPDLRPVIDTLVALAAQARARNQENGIIIQTYQRHHQDALSAWQALSGRQENRLYDARGRSKPAGRRFKTHVAAG